jgi:hypothetical protein
MNTKRPDRHPFALIIFLLFIAPLASAAASDRPWLGLALDPNSAAQNTYAQQSRIKHVRMTCYMRHFYDNRYFEADRRTPHATQLPGTMLARDWFYYDMQQARNQGYKVVLVFHDPPDDDPYGDKLPQFIADVIRPSSPTGLAHNLDDIVIAVQPGNENNIPDSGFRPLLRGNTLFERGMSHGDAICATRNALNAAGASGVEVWTSGAVWTGPGAGEFFRGVLQGACARASVGGLAVHAYGYPPSHQLEGWKSELTTVKAEYGVSTPVYATETGSESLRDGNEADGNYHVESALWWLSWTNGGGYFYTRTYWYSAGTDDGYNLIWPGANGSYTERMAGATFKTFCEANCVPAQGAYISHFTGLGCTGTESYYLPYDGYAYQCRPWDGQGRCGTIRRTVTNRSYRYNGQCYNAWESGNTLSDFVTVYR